MCVLGAWVSQRPQEPTAVTEDFNASERLQWERQCLRRFHQGEPAAFAELYNVYAPVIYRRVLVPQLGQVAAAEDALSETFRVAYERLSQFESGATSVYFWLSRIAHNKAIDMHRVKASTGRKLTNLQQMLEPLMTPADNPAELLELAVEGRTVKVMVERCLAAINPRYRRALELRFFEERSREDCAEELAVKLGTFDVLLLRALRAFRSAWEEALSVKVEEERVAR